MLVCARIQEVYRDELQHEVSFGLVIIYVTVKATRDTFFFKGAFQAVHSKERGVVGDFFSPRKKKGGWLVGSEIVANRTRTTSQERAQVVVRLTVFSATRRGRNNQSFDYFVKSM